MEYKIGKIGREFLKTMEINHNFSDPADPNIKELADITKVFDDSLPEDRNKKNFKFSVLNPHHYPRMVREIMEKLFTSTEKIKLQSLIADLEKEATSLMDNANSKVKETINKCRSGPFPGNKYGLEEQATKIVCEIFEQIPPYALKLLGLIKIQPEYFSQSYHFFEQMLKEFSQENGRTYEQKEIKGHFSKALKGLEKLVESVKKKQEKSNEKNKKQPDESLSPPPEQDKQNQSEGNNGEPTNSNENPETQNNSENDQIPNETNLANLQILKDQTISDIATALNQIPLLTISDLSSKYQDWENQINNLSDENQINFLKDGILIDIQNQRKEKIKKQTTGEVGEIMDSNFQKAQNSNATIQEKKEALADNEKYEGQPAYEDANIKEKTKNLKKEVAQSNPTEYRNKIISDLGTKLKNNRLTRKELDNETQDLIKALEEQKISDPSQLVETELKITQKIGHQAVTKKIKTFKRKARRILKSNDKTKIDELKKQLIEFMGSNNIYYQAKKSEAQQLLKQLESGSIINNSNSSETLPFSAQVGLGMGAVSIVLFFTLLIWKKKRQAFFKGPLTKS